MVNDVIASTYTAPEGNNYLEVAGIKVLSVQTFLNMVVAPYYTVCMGVSLEFCKDGQMAASHFGRKTLSLFHAQAEPVKMVLLLVVIMVVAFVALMLHPMTIFLAFVAGWHKMLAPNKPEEGGVEKVVQSGTTAWKVKMG
jgi:hypothetical protein